MNETNSKSQSTPQVHWYEGMFLQPHHFQLNNLSRAFDNYENTRHQPFWWGISHLDINETALKGGRLKIQSASLRLYNGIWLNIPDNAIIDDKDFSNELKDAENTLGVWIGIIDQQHPRNSGVYHPFLIKDMRVKDENTGDNEKEIKVKHYNVEIFFKQPDNRYHFLKIGEISRSESTDYPVFNGDYIPPILKINASTFYKEQVKNIIVHLKNQTAYLQRDIIEKKSLAGTEPTTILQKMIRLQTLSSFAQVLDQFLSVDTMHPFYLYVELARLTGALTALSPEKPLDVPLYNHDNLAEVFQRLQTTLWSLLKESVSQRFVKRNFEINKLTRRCRIDENWLKLNNNFYICVETDQKDPEEIQDILHDHRVKIAPPTRIKQLLKDKERGFTCERVRQIPPSFPQRVGLFYFQLNFSKNKSLWEDLCSEKILVIHGIPENEIHNMTFCLPVLEEVKNA